VLSEGQSFSSYDQQFVARVGWVPILPGKGTLLHVAIAGRYGLVNDQTLRLRSRPELNWYLTDHLRLEFAYGVGQLDRLGLLGTTQFLQARLQFQFRAPSDRGRRQADPARIASDRPTASSRRP
jgi:hypothetical protein